MKEKTKKIKDDEIARLASMLQKEFGQVLAAKWNADCEKRGNQPIYDSGDCRAGFVGIIKRWREEMDRD
jgi:hypothetical protein